jgi:hypothetical protein
MPAEELRLFKGVQQFGAHDWAAIHDEYFAGKLPFRRNGDLKDKWRVMQKNPALIVTLEQKARARRS